MAEREASIYASSLEPAFRACIHRGAHQIGGSCIELACAGSRLLLDLGKPLDAQDLDPALLPATAGLLN